MDHQKNIDLFEVRVFVFKTATRLLHFINFIEIINRWLLTTVLQFSIDSWNLIQTISIDNIA